MNLKQEQPEVSREQRAAAELLKRIRKLRWIGMDEEARRIVRSSLRVCSEYALDIRMPRSGLAAAGLPCADAAVACQSGK